jgi:hypothetical protein
MSIRTRPFTAVAVIVGLLAAQGVAEAALPATHNQTIVTSSSIGGVKLGQTLAQAKAAWGVHGGSCKTSPPTVICRYAGRKGDGGGAFVTLNGKVETVAISATPKPGSHSLNFSTPMARFKTSKGIGLGADIAAVKRAYPHALRLHPGTAYGLFSGRNQTLFSFTGTKLGLIQVHAS